MQKKDANMDLIVYRGLVLVFAGLLCYLMLAFIQSEFFPSAWSVAFRLIWVAVTWISFISFRQSADDRYYRTGEKEVLTYREVPEEKANDV